MPGRVAAKAATRDTNSNEACVNLSATWLLAIVVTLHFSVEENCAMDRESVSATAAAEFVCVRTITVTRGLKSGFALDSREGWSGESVAWWEREKDGLVGSAYA